MRTGDKNKTIQRTLINVKALRAGRSWSKLGLQLVLERKNKGNGYL